MLALKSILSFLDLRGEEESRAYRSLAHTWMPRKAPMSKPKPTSRPQTSGLDHGYVMPPHSKASNKQTKADIRNETPMGSNFQNSSLTVFLRLVGTRGALKEKMVKTRATKPIAVDYCQHPLSSHLQPVGV